MNNLILQTYVIINHTNKVTRILIYIQKIYIYIFFKLIILIKLSKG